MPKKKLKDIIDSDDRYLFTIKVDKFFYQINTCIANKQDKNELSLNLKDGNNNIINHVANLEEEFEYDFVDIQPRIMFKCDLCDDFIEENYGKPFKANPENIAVVTKELEDFCKDYKKSGVQRFHNCSNLEYGMTKIKGFIIA